MRRSRIRETKLGKSLKGSKCAHCWISGCRTRHLREAGISADLLSAILEFNSRLHFSQDAVQGYYPQAFLPPNEPRLAWEHTTKLRELSDRTRYLNPSICLPCSSGLFPSPANTLWPRHRLPCRHHHPRRFERPSSSLCRPRALARQTHGRLVVPGCC